VISRRRRRPVISKRPTSLVVALPSCPFCGIAADPSKCELLFEDRLTLAFMDINPANPGHCLVSPRAHYPTVLAITNEAFGAVARTTRRIAVAVDRALTPGGLSLVQANGNLAGQSVPHLHIHVLPRCEGDDLPINWQRVRNDPRRVEIGRPEQIRAVAERIRACL
jgi:histidine triad (HIT) family protein